MSTRDGEIDAVHITDLQTLLQRMGLREKFNAGKLECKFCGTKVSIENIHSILPKSGQMSIICNEPVCIQKLFEYLSEHKKTPRL